jgi:hypothetical protein
MQNYDQLKEGIVLKELKAVKKGKTRQSNIDVLK